jgi:hypothetical protein
VVGRISSSRTKVVNSWCLGSVSSNVVASTQAITDRNSNTSNSTRDSQNSIVFRVDSRDQVVSS